jgi:hypothetical protein
MNRAIAMVAVFTVAVVSICAAGSNPNAKVAVHVMSHASRSCTKNFPTIDDCEDIVYTYSGGGDIDFFVVFYDLAAYQGFGYAMTWPAEWSSCSFTSCSDLTIGTIESPGDSVAHAYSSCDSSDICIPGFGWVDAGEDPGYIRIVDFLPVGRIEVGDCSEGSDSLVLNCRAGVNGYSGDDPCSGRGGDGGDGEGEGESGGLRSYYKP